MKDADLTTDIPVSDFQTVYSIIQTHRQRIAKRIDTESLTMLWEVGGYISHKLNNAEWGDGVVKKLAEYIRIQDAAVRGWSSRTLYKMVQFYETYSSESFAGLVKQLRLEAHAKPKQITGPSDTQEIVPFELAQFQDIFVPIKLAQIPNVLFSTGWSNHLTIMSRCKADGQRLFYMLYAEREHLKNKELERAITTDTMSSLLGGKDVQSAALQQTYEYSPVLFKDTAYLDFLGLPKTYKETRLRKGIVEHMKEFILEMGKDFLFIDQEHPVTVGGKTFKIDLLFYHRLLQCMVAFELKTTEFQPAYQGQLEFYLEALDQEERRSNENPTIGIILCKESDQDVVRFALNRSMSPMLVMQYKEQLKIGGVIQRSLVEYCNYISKEEKNAATEQ